MVWERERRERRERRRGHTIVGTLPHLLVTGEWGELAGLHKARCAVARIQGFTIRGTQGHTPLVH